MSGVLPDGPASAERMRSALEAAGLGIWDWDVRTGSLSWDERILELHGLDPLTFDGTLEAFLEQVHPNDRPDLQAAIAGALERCGSFLHEFRVLRRDGTTAWVQGRGSVRCEGGTPVRMIGIGAETTDLHDVRERAGRTLEHVSDAVSVLSTDWTIEFVNGPAARLLGRTPSDLVGRNLWEEFPDAEGTPFAQAYRRAMATQQPETLQAYYGPLDGWFEVRVFPAPDGLTTYSRNIDAERIAEAERDELITRLSAGLERDRELLKLTRTLGGALGRAEVADAVTRLTSEALGSLFTGVALIAGEGTHVEFLSMEPLPEDVQATWTRFPLDAPVPGADTARTGKRLAYHARSEIVARYPHIAEDLARAGTEAMVTLPLTGPEGTIGVLMVTWAQPRPLDEDELRFLDTLAGQCAQALQRADLFTRQRSVVEILQRAIIPEQLPEHDLVELGARYRSAEGDADVGGDWYDAFASRDGTLILIVGDVGGHGVGAAALMGQLRNAARAYALDGAAPAEVLTKLNRLLVHDDAGIYATVLCIALAPDAAQLRYASAGHPPPVLLADGRPELLEDVHGPMVGVAGDAVYRDTVVKVPDDATLVLYTDGLVEHRSRSLEEGLERLRDVVADAGDESLDRLLDVLMTEVLPDGVIRADDVAVLVARRRA